MRKSRRFRSRFNQRRRRRHHCLPFSIYIQVVVMF